LYLKIFLKESYIKRLKIAKSKILDNKGNINFFMDKLEGSFIESPRKNKSPYAGGET